MPPFQRSQVHINRPCQITIKQRLSGRIAIVDVVKHRMRENLTISEEKDEVGKFPKAESGKVIKRNMPYLVWDGERMTLLPIVNCR